MSASRRRFEMLPQRSQTVPDEEQQPDGDVGKKQRFAETAGSFVKKTRGGVATLGLATTQGAGAWPSLLTHTCSRKLSLQADM